MPIIKLNGTQLEVDENGYITDPSLWNEDLAILLAKHAEGIIELTKNY